MRRFFSLVELLVVIAVISILAALLLPALQKARDQAKLIHCVSNEKQVATGLLSYADDYNKWGPPVGSSWTYYYMMPGRTLIGYITQPHAPVKGSVLPGPYVCPDFPKTDQPAGTICGPDFDFYVWDASKKPYLIPDEGILTSYGIIFGSTSQGTGGPHKGDNPDKPKMVNDGYFWYGWNFTQKTNFGNYPEGNYPESKNYFRPFPRLIMLGTAQHFELLTNSAYTHDYQFPPASRQPIGGDLKNSNYLEDKLLYYGSGSKYPSPRSPHKSLLSTNTMFADGHVKSSAWKGEWKNVIHGVITDPEINFNR